MENLDKTICKFYETTAYITRLNTLLIENLRQDILELGPLTELDRVHLTGILG